MKSLSREDFLDTDPLGNKEDEINEQINKRDFLDDREFHEQQDKGGIK